ncbi:MAG: CsgG/HfaB family protein [bacterium]
MVFNKAWWLIFLTGSIFTCAILFISCTPRSILSEGGATIAVWDLDNLSPSASGNPDMGQILSTRITETIMSGGKVTVIERERLLLALEELNLGSSSLADEATRLKLGRLVGAQAMVFGAYQVFGQTMRLDLRLVEVGTGKVMKAVQKTTPDMNVSQWLEAAREAAEGLL